MKVEFEWKDFLVQLPEFNKLIIMKYNDSFIIGHFRQDINTKQSWVIAKTLEVKINSVGSDRGKPTLTLSKQLSHKVYLTVEECELLINSEYKQLWDYYNL